MIVLNVDIGTIALVCMAMVFLVLFFLSVIYLMLPKLLDIYFRKKMESEGKVKIRKNAKGSNEPIEGNVNAAIAVALHMYMNDMHDEESNVITIEDVQRAYSPWRSKIYGVMNDPRR
ncbi:MAG: hypothetical protein CSA36_00015 [Draconibacterium sp.]|nr:MAG: hypothetical protein CSA36_00015 [Draconibacterium sp.]